MLTFGVILVLPASADDDDEAGYNVDITTTANNTTEDKTESGMFLYISINIWFNLSSCYQNCYQICLLQDGLQKGLIFKVKTFILDLC